jgi:hypothetical protein
MWRYIVVARSVMFALIAAVSIPLLQKLGAWPAAGLTASILAVCCVLVGVAMGLQPPGRMSIVNYGATFILPWGYKIGRGRIIPIIVESWLKWTLIASAMILSQSQPRLSLISSIVLPVSWLVIGEGLWRLLTHLLTRANSNPLPPGTLTPIAGMTLLLVASALLTAFGTTPWHLHLALLLTAAPVGVVCGGYGLMLLAMLTSGRHARWN